MSRDPARYRHRRLALPQPMFDEISADLRKAGHRITRYAHREAFAATPDPLAGIDILLCVGGVSADAARCSPARRGCAPSCPP